MGRGDVVVNVSIRAPVKGAIAQHPRIIDVSQCFNPRPHEGGDFPARRVCSSPAGFNPRPREGGDYSMASSA